MAIVAVKKAVLCAREEKKLVRAWMVCSNVLNVVVFESWLLPLIIATNHMYKKLGNKQTAKCYLSPTHPP